MIGKVVRMLVGRSVARRNGLSGAAGAAAAVIAPAVLSKLGGAVARRRAAKKAARREREAPRYVGPITETEPKR